jgi:predicted esterase
MRLCALFFFVAVRQRQGELREMKEYILHNPLFPAPLRAILDASKVCVAGFSYGAATASLEAVTHPSEYAACLLLDGWFHIEAGDGFDFPQETHDKGTVLYLM